MHASRRILLRLLRFRGLSAHQCERVQPNRTMPFRKVQDEQGQRSIDFPDQIVSIHFLLGHQDSGA